MELPEYALMTARGPARKQGYDRHSFNNVPSNLRCPINKESFTGMKTEVGSLFEASLSHHSAGCLYIHPNPVRTLVELAPAPRPVLPPKI